MMTTLVPVAENAAGHREKGRPNRSSKHPFDAPEFAYWTGAEQFDALYRVNIRF
jgi:hypothetical protein